MQDEKCRDLLIWRDEVCFDEILDAIFLRINDELVEENDNFVARIKKKQDTTEKKLDSVDQIPRKLIHWIFHILLLFVCNLYGTWEVEKKNLQAK